MASGHFNQMTVLAISVPNQRKVIEWIEDGESFESCKRLAKMEGFRLNKSQYDCLAENGIPIGRVSGKPIKCKTCPLWISSEVCVRCELQARKMRRMLRVLHELNS